MHVDAKSLKILKMIAKNLQCFIMFSLVSGFSCNIENSYNYPFIVLIIGENNFICNFYLLPFFMFLQLTGFSKNYSTLQLNDWKSVKQIVTKNLQIWKILAKIFSIFFMFLLVTDFSKRYSTLQFNDCLSGKQSIAKTLQIWANRA